MVRLRGLKETEMIINDYFINGNNGKEKAESYFLSHPDCLYLELISGVTDALKDPPEATSSEQEHFLSPLSLNKT